MDLFEQRAREILDTARVGSISEMAVLFGHDGGLHLIMGASSTATLSAAEHTALYRLTRSGTQLQVNGISGDRRCHVKGRALPYRPALLLDNQPRYTVLPPALSDAHYLSLE